MYKYYVAHFSLWSLWRNISNKWVAPQSPPLLWLPFRKTSYFFLKVGTCDQFVVRPAKKACPYDRLSSRASLKETPRDRCPYSRTHQGKGRNNCGTRVKSLHGSRAKSARAWPSTSHALHCNQLSGFRKTTEKNLIKMIYRWGSRTRLNFVNPILSERLWP